MKTVETKIFKPSKYNFTIRDRDKKVYIFNGLLSSLIQLPEALYPAAQDLFSRKMIFASILPLELTPFFEILKEGGFIVENTFDELAIIKERFGLRPQSGQLVKLWFTVRKKYGKNNTKKTYTGIQDIHNSGA